jgi:hypothetical protein
MDKRNIQIALDIFVIILILIGAIYIYLNWDWLHSAVTDPCQVCMDKTGGICSQGLPSAEQQRSYSEEINFSAITNK